MYFNGRYNKNNKNFFDYKNKILLNNKTHRQKIKHNNNKMGKNDFNSEQNSEIEIPGFYYDKNKNRYFSLKDREILNEIKNKTIDKNEPKIINNKPKKPLSHFNMIFKSRILEKNILNKFYDRKNYLKNSNYINIEYTGDKFPNNIYLFYMDKYLLTLDYFNDNNNRMTTIIIHDIINNVFIKKIIIENIYNDFMILENNLILIDNITKISIINNINNIIKSKDKMINIDIINIFTIKINNIDNISMVYKWPFIALNNNIYYYLIWNNFYLFDLNDEKNKNTSIILNKYNNDILYIAKNEIINNRNRNVFNINKIDIKKKYHYINFFINNDNKNKNFYFFTYNGEIHKYKFKKNNIFTLKQIIKNDILMDNSVIKICYYYNNNYLLISNKSIIYNLDLINQTMTEINIKKNCDNNNSKINYKFKIFEYNDILNCIIYEKDDSIIFFSLDDFSEIKTFKMDNYKYNILLINNRPKIV